MSKILTFAASALFVSVFIIEDQLHLTARYEAGTLLRDVIRVQAGRDIAIERNMSQLLRMVNCVRDTENCKKASPYFY